MSDQQLMHEGLGLMTFGMGFVFVFLTLLVIATTLMSRAVTRWLPAPVAEKSAPHRQSAADDGELMAVIGAAVHRYRRHRR